jgi:hypothetical protein
MGREMVSILLLFCKPEFSQGKSSGFQAERRIGCIFFPGLVSVIMIAS